MTQCQSLFEQSLWTSKKTVVETNKTKRKLTGDYINDEPVEHYFDQVAFDESSSGIRPRMWQSYHYLSEQWVKDLFGLDWSCASFLMNVLNLKPYENGNGLYYSEADIMRLIETISVSQKIGVSQSETHTTTFFKPVYTNEDLKLLLNVGDSTLRKYRDNLLLDYSKVGDKIWYSAADLENFLHKTNINNQN